MCDKKKGEMILLGPPDESGRSPAVIRQDGKVIHGMAGSPLRSGKPVFADEVIQVRKNESSPVSWDVMDRISLRSKGPAKYSSEAFRANYDEVFKTDLLN